MRNAAAVNVRRMALVTALALALLVGLVPDARAARSQPIGSGTIGVVGGVTDPFALGVFRTWDSGTNWCDLQPTEDANIPANLERLLAPRLDQALQLGASGAVITLGHPAAWVFGNDRRALRKGRSWYCNRNMAGTSIPRSRDLRPGSLQYERFSRYAEAVMQFVANRYAGQLSVSFQVWNEPNLTSGINPKGKVRGAASSWSDAAKALYAYEGITRNLIDSTFPDKGFSLIATSLYQRKKKLNSAYLRLHARRPLVSALSYNMYTRRGRTAPAMVNDFDFRVRQVSSQVRRYRALRDMPIMVTEFNHNLVNHGQNKYNLSPAITNPAAQRLLASASLMDALYHGFSSVLWYSPWVPGQAAVRIGETGGAARLSLGVLRSALQDTTLTDCYTSQGTRTCLFTTQLGAVLKVHWRPKGTSTITADGPSMLLQMDGAREPVEFGTPITVGLTPVIIGPR